MSPRDVTVGDLAALRSVGVRYTAARVTSTGIVAVVTHTQGMAALLGPRSVAASSRRLATLERSCGQAQRALEADIEAHVATMLARAADDDLVACDRCGGREVRCCARCSGTGGVPRYAVTGGAR